MKTNEFANGRAVRRLAVIALSLFCVAGWATSAVRAAPSATSVAGVPAGTVSPGIGAPGRGLAANGNIGAAPALPQTSVAPLALPEAARIPPSVQMPSQREIADAVNGRDSARLGPKKEEQEQVAAAKKQEKEPKVEEEAVDRTDARGTFVAPLPAASGCRNDLACLAVTSGHSSVVINQCAGDSCSVSNVYVQLPPPRAESSPTIQIRISGGRRADRVRDQHEAIAHRSPPTVEVVQQVESRPGL